MRVITVADGPDAARWDAYVLPRTDTATDRYAWRRVLEDAYGIRAHFLAALEDDQVAGTLGLFEIRHPLFGHYLTTAPYGNDGGFHFDGTEARDALLAEARRASDRLGVRYLVIRSRDGALSGFHVDRSYVASAIDLGPGAQALWAALPGTTRNQIRRGQKEGFTLHTGPEQADAFFDVFHEHMRDLGSPAHARRFYHAIARHFGDRAEFMVLRDGSELAAGALLFRGDATAMNLHTVALRRFNRRCPNYLLYWTMIRESCERGCRWFDMGRARAGSPQAEFKRNWNAREIPLTYNYLLRTVRHPPDLDPRNPAFRAAISLWQRLPVAWTKRIGPRLITGLA